MRRRPLRPLELPIGTPFGEVRALRLPNSRLTVTYST